MSHPVASSHEIPVDILFVCARSPIGELLDRYLGATRMTVSEAAQHAGIPVATLHHLIDAGRVPNGATRDKLLRLGLTRAEIDYVSALTAGYDVTPAGVEPLEWARILRMRSMSDASRDVVDAEIWRQSQPISGRTRRARPQTRH